MKQVIRKKFKNKKGGFKFSAKNKKHVTDTASILDKTFNLKPISRNEFKFPVPQSINRKTRDFENKQTGNVREHSSAGGSA